MVNLLLSAIRYYYASRSGKSQEGKIINFCENAQIARLPQQDFYEIYRTNPGDSSNGARCMIGVADVSAGSFWQGRPGAAGLAAPARAALSAIGLRSRLLRCFLRGKFAFARTVATCSHREGEPAFSAGRNARRRRGSALRVCARLCPEQAMLAACGALAAPSFFCKVGQRTAKNCQDLRRDEKDITRILPTFLQKRKKNK